MLILFVGQDGICCLSSLHFIVKELLIFKTLEIGQEMFEKMLLIDD